MHAYFKVFLEHEVPSPKFIILKYIYTRIKYVQLLLQNNISQKLQLTFSKVK